MWQAWHRVEERQVAAKAGFADWNPFSSYDALSKQMIFIAVFPFTCIAVIAYVIIALILILKMLIRHS